MTAFRSARSRLGLAKVALLRTGHAIDPRSLDGWAYRGTVLATPVALAGEEPTP